MYGARMPGLDLLRMGGGLALIVCHAGYWLAPFGIPDTVWMLFGHAGVELFLVTFGFLLAERAFKATRPVAIGREWARSALRLWPLYLLFLLCNLALSAADANRPPWIEYLTLTQNLAWPHPGFFAEAWIVAAAAMIALVVPLLCHMLHSSGSREALSWLLGMFLLANLLRGLLVWLGNPAFDLGVRKILIARLDLPIYGVVIAWLWVHRYAAIMRWRGILACIAVVLLGITALIHMLVPLDQSLAARILLLPICDVAWAALVPWACSLTLPQWSMQPARTVAGSAYAGLLTHMTALRLAGARGLSLTATDPVTGVLMLFSFVLLAIGVALLIRLALDLPLIGMRDRGLPTFTQHFAPVPER